MKLLKIQKRPGSFRTVCAPDPEQKAVLRQLVGRLEQKARAACPEPVLQGFTRGKSPVTNAKAHQGFMYSLCFDLEDFFDTVTPVQLKGKISKEEAGLVLIDPGDGRGLRAMQGLPTSPAVANIAASDMDKALLQAIHKSGYAIVYTRYADDLTFSFNNAQSKAWLMENVPGIVARCGFRLNARKTHFQPASVGRRIVTGVSVGESDIKVPRAVRRRIRAAKHQAECSKRKRVRATAANSLRGLTEWAKLKTPKKKQADPFGPWRDTLKKLIPFWRLGAVRLAPPRECYVPDRMEGDFLITHDPGYMLGMSTYTTGWTSCMAQPGGGYSRSTVLWFNNPGTSVAALLSNTTKSFAGVERRVMRARTLVHAFEDGTFGYDRVYGDVASVQLLEAWLGGLGYVKLANARRTGRKVVRGIPSEPNTIYRDTLSVGIVDGITRLLY